MRLLIGACICLAVLLQPGCSNETNTPVIIPEDSMKLIVWDMIKADEWFSKRIMQDSTAIRNKEDIKLYEMVFKVHGVTRERFFTSYRYYEGRPVSFKRMLDSLDAFANRERLKHYERERGKK